MRKISRRKAIEAAGLAVGAYLSGRFMATAGAPSQGTNNESEHVEWKHVKLDPEKVAARAYELYPEGSCMYASFKSICSSMAEAVVDTNPSLSKALREFPCHMMKYGHSGLGGQGSLCGALNGAGAAFGLFIKEKSTVDALLAELCSFYESAKLPVFKPENSKFEPMTQSISRSVLCHVSQTAWCHRSGQSPFSEFRIDRCKRLTADIAAMAVNILNRYADNATVNSNLQEKEYQRCIDCHGRNGEGIKISAKMNCVPCHKMEDHYE